MANVEVTITVSDEGVVQSVRAGAEEFARLEESVEGAASASDDFASTQSQVSDAARQSGDGVAQAASQSAAYEKALQALNQRGIRTTDQLREQRDELERLQGQFPQNSQAARALQAEIDRLGDKIGQKSVQDIQRQIQQLRRLEKQLITLSGVMRQAGDTPPISREAVQGLESAEKDLDQFQATAVDATEALGDVRSRIETLNQELQETRAPDTQISAYEQAVRDLNNAGVVTTSQLEDMRDELQILQGVFEDDERVVRELQEQIERLNREIELNGEASEGASEEAAQHASMQERLNDVGIRTTDQIREQIQLLEGLQSDLNESAREYGLLEDRIIRLREEMERAGNRTAEFGRQTAKSRQFIFSAGDAVQDLRFGVAGAGNNIAFMAEQLSEMSATATSAGGIISSLSTAILGPAGLILALQAIIGLGPVVANKIQEISLASDELSVSTEDAKESFSEMVSLLQASQQEFSVSRLVASQLRDELSNVSEEISSTFSMRLEQLIREVEMFNDQFNADVFEGYRRQLRQVLVGNEDLQESLEEVGINMDLLMESGQLTEEQMRQLRKSFVENKNSLRNLESITEGAEQSLDELVQSSRRAELQQRRFNRAIEEGLTAQELYADTQRQLTELSGELQDQLELGLISEQEALERQANLIEEVLNLAAGTELAGTQPIEDLRRQWDQLNAELKETEDAAEGSTDSLTQALEDFEDLKDQLAFEERVGIGTEADRARRKAEFLRETIKELGPDVNTSSEAFQTLVEKMRQFSAEADRLAADSLKVDELRQGFEDLLQTQSREFELGITDNLQAAEDQVKFLEDALQQIADSGVDMDTKGVEELQNQLAAAEAIVQSYEDSAQEALSVQEQFEQTFLKGSNAAKNFQEHIGGMSDEIQQLSGVDQVLAGFTKEIDRIAQMMDEGELENAEFFLEALREKLQKMKEEADGATPVIDEMLSKLDRLEGRLQSLTPEVETFGEALENIKKRGDQIAVRALTSGFRELGRAVGEGAGAIEAFGQTAQKMLSDLAAMLGRMLIRMGVSTIIANPVQGAALIAAGGGLLALSGALGGSRRGRGRGARTGRGQGPEPAEQETSFRQAEDVPGRRTGGPVMAGRPYRVGEGETEVMVPRISGQVVPQSAFSQRGQPSRQVVEVRSSMDGQVEMGSRMRDLGFQLRDLIQEAESSISEST